MSPLVAPHTGSSGLLAGCAVGLALSEVAIRFRIGVRRGAPAVDRGSIAVVVASVLAGVLAGLWSTGSVPAARLGGWAAPVGAALVILGIAVRQWAVFTLGRFFTVVVRVAEGQTVVDRGPYRWVRHPSYTGLLLSLLGLGLMLGNAVSALCLVVLPLAGLVFRIRVEERALLSALGQPYADYAARRRRLVPGIW